MVCSAVAIEVTGGPDVDVKLGREDKADAAAGVPPNGRLPDASQGAEHLREVRSIFSGTVARSDLIFSSASAKSDLFLGALSRGPSYGHLRKV